MLHQPCAVHAFRDGGIVRGDDNRGVRTRNRFQQCIHGPPSRWMVQLAGWLISKNQPGLWRNSPGKGHALRLASGQLVWKLVGDTGKANCSQGLHCLAPRRRDVAGEPQWELDVLDDTQRWNQARRLEHDADVFWPQRAMPAEPGPSQLPARRQIEISYKVE